MLCWSFDRESMVNAMNQRSVLRLEDMTFEVILVSCWEMSKSAVIFGSQTRSDAILDTDG